MDKIEKKNFDTPDEVRDIPNSKITVLNLGGQTIMKAAFHPGWRWSKDVKPTAGTDSCQAHHFGYVISGRLKVVGDDGTEIEAGPGDVVNIPPGHDAWVVGDEPFVNIDFTAGNTYAK